MAPAAVSHGLPSGLLSDISAPLQFPAGTSSLTGIAGNVTDLPNLDNEPMQGLADVYTGDWNLWRDQHQNGLPGDWNNFFGRHESTDNA
ncbi:hypothetical protein SBRCBS47491_010173 [Sporothrix bragantina]|uniref:Uncharacterized protein n=1 Tax=Sporothrix bragantina TaxID=671064 RepID=A0ABP0D0B1_9PEZI